MKHYRFIALLGSLLCFNVSADNLVFGSYVPGYPPLMYMQDRQFHGVFPELHRAFSQHLARQPEFRHRSRKHAEQGLYEGTVHAMALNPQWAESPEQLIFSKPIIESADFLYSLAGARWPPESGANVCAREHYQYPEVQPLFDDATLTRVDVTSQEAQFRMLATGRCEFAVMNRFVTQWYQQKQFNDLSLTEHTEHSSQVFYRFAFPADEQALRDEFNRFLEQYVQLGLMEELIHRYLPPPTARSASTNQN